MPCRTPPSIPCRTTRWCLLDDPAVTLDVFDSAPLYALAMAHGGWGGDIVWDGKLAAYLLDASASKYQVSGADKL